MLSDPAAEQVGQICAAGVTELNNNWRLVTGVELHRVGRETALATLRLTQSLLERHGPRIAGTRQCLNAADQIAEMLRVHCDRVAEERFEMHPGSFWVVGKVMAASYVLSVLFLLAGGLFVYLSFLCAVFGLAYGAVLYVFNGRSFDKWFAGAEGCNVSGVIEPEAEVKQQVIVSGHHDSPYVLSFLLGWKRVARLRIVLAVLIYAAAIGVAAAAIVGGGIGSGEYVPAGIIWAEVILGLVFVAPLYTLITRLQSPGAGDNLNSTAMAITAGVHFDLRRKKGSPLKHTRIIVLSTDGEEVGMRGAMDYARSHAHELQAIPTFVFNMDSIYTLRDLTLLTRDKNGTRRLSESMAKECHRIAVNLGLSPRVMRMPVGGGGTDASAFAEIGVESISVIGISVSNIGEDTVYHTPQDTVESIEPEAVEAVLDMAVNYIMSKDQQIEMSETGKTLAGSSEN